jgi:hypothetical protein
MITYGLEKYKIILKSKPSKTSSPCAKSLSPTLVGMVKLNFNGALKGNWGPISIGGVFKHSYRKILLLFTSFGGININILAKLQALKGVIFLTKKDNWSNIHTFKETPK